MKSFRAVSSGSILEVRLHELLQVTVENAIDISDLNSSSKVFHHPIGLKNVRTNLTSESDFQFAVLDRLRFRLLFFHLELEKPGAQNFHADVAVLVLGPLILALNDDTGRKVCYPHRRIR